MFSLSLYNLVLAAHLAQEVVEASQCIAMAKKGRRGKRNRDNQMRLRGLLPRNLVTCLDANALLGRSSHAVENACAESAAFMQWPFALARIGPSSSTIVLFAGRRSEFLTQLSRT